METISTSMPLTEIKLRANREILQILSILLQYPQEEWLKSEEWNEVVEALPSAIREILMPYTNYLSETPFDQLAEEYVQTFDFSSKTTLYLTYSKMGEERERGKWLVDLKQQYRDAGFDMTDEELSDYLPLVLEFFSIAPIEEVKSLFQTFQPAIEQLYEALHKSQKPHAAVIAACLAVTSQVVQDEMEGGVNG